MLRHGLARSRTNARNRIGIGVISTLTGSTAASVAFAAMIIVFALSAFAFGLKATKD